MPHDNLANGIKPAKKVLFLHGKESGPGGTKPKYLAEHGFTVINPALPADDFESAVRIAQAAFDEHAPDVVVGSSRGGAVAMNFNSGNAGMVLLAPAWTKWGDAKTVKPQTRVIHSRQDAIIPFADSEALVANSPAAVLVEIGTDHRLSTPEPLAAMLDTVRTAGSSMEVKNRKALRFKTPPGSRFDFGTDESGEHTVLSIWVPAAGGFTLLAPDGTPGKVAFSSRGVSEEEFWSLVAQEDPSHMGNCAGRASAAENKLKFETAQPMPCSESGGKTT